MPPPITLVVQGTTPDAGKTPPGGGLAPMLDLNGDGNPLDDIMGMIGKVTR